MSLHTIKIKLKSFHSPILDKAVAHIVNVVKEAGGNVCGPIPLPRKIERFTVTKSPHVDTKGKDQYSKTKYTRVILIIGATALIIEELSKMDIPSGVGIEISITKA